MDRWEREHDGRVREILMTFAYEQSGLSAWVLHDDEPDMSVDETRGCDHCRQHHVNLNLCTRKGCRRQQCDVHLYGESPFAGVCLTCNLKEYVLRLGDPQDEDSPCNYLCRVLGVPLPMDLGNQVLQGIRYDFRRLREIHVHYQGGCRCVG
eukprot:598654-Amphidinium_carterae.1